MSPRLVSWFPPLSDAAIVRIPRISGRSMATTDRAADTGSRLIIANRYEIDLDNPLGVGGMATVYRGRDLRARRPVAVKTLRPEYQRNPDSRRKFRQEARMMAFVSHPNLVSIYDLHDDTSGSWMVMEYVEGQNLKDILTEEGPLDPETVMGILDQVGKAIHPHPTQTELFGELARRLLARMRRTAKAKA